jgi:hypothetical protein
MSDQDLRSDLLVSISLASETELFIHQVQQDRVTTAFAKGHMAYLAKDSADELRQAHANNATKGALENGCEQLDLMAALLTGLKDKTGDKASLSAAAERAANIRMSLEHTKNEL